MLKTYLYNADGLKELDEDIQKEIFKGHNVSSAHLPPSVILLFFEVVMEFNCFEQRVRHVTFFLKEGTWYPASEQQYELFFKGYPNDGKEPENFDYLSSCCKILKTIPAVTSYPKSKIFFEIAELINNARNFMLHDSLYTFCYSIDRDSLDLDWLLDKTDKIKNTMDLAMELFDIRTKLDALKHFSLHEMLTGKPYRPIMGKPEVKAHYKKLIEHKKKDSRLFGFSNKMKNLLDKYKTQSNQ